MSVLREKSCTPSEPLFHITRLQRHEVNQSNSNSNHGTEHGMERSVESEAGEGLDKRTRVIHPTALSIKKHEVFFISGSFLLINMFGNFAVCLRH